MTDTLPTNTGTGADPSLFRASPIDATEHEALAIKEALLSELPLIEIGNTDPLNPDNSDFPNVMYHGARADEFALDDTRDYATRVYNQGTTGSRSGKGLYCGSKEVAQGFNNGSMVEILPGRVSLLDMTSPRMEEPMSETFRSLMADLQTERLEKHADPYVPELLKVISEYKPSGEPLTRGDRIQLRSQILKDATASDSKLDTAESTRLTNLVEETTSRYNTRLLLNDPSTSLGQLFRQHDTNNGAKVFVDIEHTLDFLVGELGLDGAKTKQTFGDEQLAPELKEGYVFWKLDKVGDKETWQKRGKVVQSSGGLSVASSGVEVKSVYEPGLSLEGNRVLTKDESGEIKDKANRKEGLISSDKIDPIVKALAAESVDPYTLVLALAEGSDSLAALLRAHVGVHEGYRLHEHTQAVLGQFEQNYADKPGLGQADRQVLRTALLLQDIGKSLAVARIGDSSQQTKYNSVLARNILTTVSDDVLAPEQKQLIVALVSHDIIGSLLQNKIDESTAEQQSQRIIDTVPVSQKEFVKKYMQIMYMCDAKAYTSDASFVVAETGETRSAQGSLDRLFVRSGGKLGTLAEEPRARVKALMGKLKT